MKDVKKRSKENFVLEVDKTPKELERKVIIIEKTPYGSNVFETIGEETKPMTTKTFFHGKRNPNKKTIFQIVNKWKEKLSIVHYKGNNFLSIFVDGGFHHSRFMLSEEQITELLSTCTKYKIMLEKLKEENGVNNG
jgi:hypothetical protein